jgi:hypothetical protein
LPHKGQPKPPYCDGDLPATHSASGFFFSSFRVQKITLPNPQKALKFVLANALKESGSIEKANVCSI